jgi:hypothetical protein
MPAYVWKPNFSPSVDPQIAGEFIEKIAKENDGGVTAAALLKASKPKKSPLHSVFEWDDGVAANKFREGQAREILRAIVLVNDAGEESTVRAFIHVKSQEAYLPTLVVMSDQALRAEALQRAWAELESWRKRYSDLKEFGLVFDAISNAKKAG